MMKKSLTLLLRATTVLIVGTATFSLSGCAEIMKGISGAASGLMTEKTANIALATVQASYITNLYGQDTREIGAEIFGPEWQAGKNAIGVLFLKKQGIGFYEIDGTLGYRNVGSNEPLKPLKYIANGMHAAILDGSDVAPKEIVVKTSVGQEARFVVQPLQPVKVTAINGKSEGAMINTNQDLVLDLDIPKGKTGQIRVSLISTVMTNRAFVDIGVFKPQKKLVIPAAAFRHLSVSSSAQSFVALDNGPNFLRVEHFEARGKDTLKTPTVAAFQNLGLAWDTVPVTLSGDARDQSFLTIKGEMPASVPQKLIRYEMTKSNAFYSPPLVAAKKLGMASVTVEGTLFEQKRSESTSDYGSYRVTTITTITKEFPQLPDTHWDQMLQSLHNEAGALFTQQFKHGIVPTEKMVAAKTYQELEEPEATLTKSFIRRNHKGSKYLMARSLGGIIASTSSTLAEDRPPSRLMRETGTDGLLSLDLNLQIATDDEGRLILIPVLNFKIDGPPNGYVVGPTSYATGSIYGTGVPFSKAELSNPANLSRVVQQKELLAALKKGLTELEAKAEQAGYHAIWKLK
jgi:hypothetical protein